MGDKSCESAQIYEGVPLAKYWGWRWRYSGRGIVWPVRCNFWSSGCPARWTKQSSWKWANIVTQIRTKTACSCNWLEIVPRNDQQINATYNRRNHANRFCELSEHLSHGFQVHDLGVSSESPTVREKPRPDKRRLRRDKLHATLAQTCEKIWSVRWYKPA